MAARCGLSFRRPYFAETRLNRPIKSSLPPPEVSTVCSAVLISSKTSGTSPSRSSSLFRFALPVNPKLLKDLATKTGGSTYVASDAKSLQASFHDVLDKLEKTKFEANIANYEDLFAFLLLPGVLLLAADAVLRALVLRRFP